jgi:hypothetical protein
MRYQGPEQRPRERADMNGRIQHGYGYKLRVARTVAAFRSRGPLTIGCMLHVRRCAHATEPRTQAFSPSTKGRRRCLEQTLQSG